jgi:L-threonylcarbamoyladenylate synthase
VIKAREPTGEFPAGGRAGPPTGKDEPVRPGLRPAYFCIPSYTRPVGGRRIAVRGESLAGGEDALARVLARGGVVGYPTETYYGLGASPWDEAAAARLLALKGERGDRPIPLVLESRAAVLKVAAAVPAALDLLAGRFWPGPLTLVLVAREDLAAAVSAGSGTVGVRVSSHAVARTVARLAGGAATATSANPSGKEPPRTADEVEAYFGDSLDLLLDAGPAPGGPPSTVLDLVAEPPRIVRPGAVPAKALAAALGLALEALLRRG